jgi:RHS repeat-associated protein
MSVAFVVGLVGARAQYVAAASTSPQLSAPPAQPAAVTDSSAVAEGLYQSLYVPTNPDLWCGLGWQGGDFSLGDNGSLVINGDCQQIGPEDGGVTVVAQNSNVSHPLPFQTACNAAQGPAGDGDADPSGIGLSCANYDTEGEDAYVNVNFSDPDNLDAESAWVDLYGTGGRLLGGNSGSEDYTITGTGSSEILTVSLDNNTITLSPPPAFTQATGWIELTETQDPGCLYVDNQGPVCGGGGSPYSQLAFGGAIAPQPAPTQWWGFGEWQDQYTVADPPTWADFGALGCPGAGTSGCAPLDDNGTDVVPASCADVGTTQVGGTGLCTWSDLSAYWFAMITAIAATSQQSLDGGPITSSEEPFGNLCIPCLLKELADAAAVGHPVNPEFGDMDEAVNDISIPGRGLPLQVARTYDTLNVATDSPFGYGWTSNLFMSLSQTGGAGSVTITQEGGAQVVFDQNGTTYTPAAPRDIATLTQNANGTWTFTRQAQDTYVFSSTGQLLSETDLNGYTTSFAYNVSGQLTTVTDPSNRILEIGWTGHTITSVTDPNLSPSRVVTYEYDSLGDLTDVIDVNGGDTHYTYNGSHQMTNILDPNCDAAGSACNGGYGVVTSYNSAGQVASQQDQLGRTTTFSYSGDPSSSLGGATTITDPAGDVTVDTYEYGVLVAQTVGYGTPQAATTSWTYDPATAAVISETDPNGGTTTHTVDASGNVLSTTDPLGRATSATYNSFNEPLTKTDGNGVTTTHTYDAHGNLLTESTPLVGTSQTATTTYTYGDSYAGDVTGITDPDSYATTHAYDTYGDQTSSTNPVGDTTTTCYNMDGWKVASYTPKAGSITCGTSPPSSPYETTYSYVQANGQVDGFGDVQKVTAPLDETTSYTYDADRNLISTTDADGNPTTYVYDLANEQTDVKQANSTDQRTDYTLDGKVLDQKDGNGHAVLTYGYNALNEVTSETDALGHVTSFTYDGDGNQLTEQQPGGNCAASPATGCATMTHDADNELTSITYSSGTTPNVTSITYDSDGQQTGMTDGTGTSSWTWNSLHDLTSYTGGAGAELQYQYNLDGLLTQITYPGNLSVTEAYNKADQWTSTEDWLGHTFTYAYDADGNLTSTTLPAGTSEVDSAAFNAADQLTSITDTKATSTLFGATYGRNGDGELTSDSSEPSTVGSYQYTTVNQLCYAGSADTAACSTPPSGSDAYSFDAAGNLTGNSGTTQSFNADDQLCWTVSGTSADGCSTTPTGATSYAYNAEGDLTTMTPSTGSATNLGYNQANQLTSYGTGSTTTATYTYNGNGLRMSQTVGGVTIPYTWDVSGSEPLLISDGTYDYMYGPGDVALEQVIPQPAITLVGTASASGKATSLTLTLPTGTTVGEQVVVASTQPSTTTVTAPSGYTQVATVTSAGSSPKATTTVFRQTVVSGETSVKLTYSTSSTAQAAVLAVYKGVDPNLPIDVSATGSTSAAGTTVTAPSVTPTNVEDQLLVFQGATGTFSGKTWTAPTGTTERVQGNSTANVSAGLADQPLTLGATGTRVSTYGASANLTSVSVALSQPHTISLVGTATASGQATSLTITLPTGTVAGDELVVASTQPSTTTVTAPSGYTQIATVTSGGSAPKATTTVFRQAVVSGETSVKLTYSVSSTAQSAVVAVYQGADPNLPIDVSATGSTSAAGKTVTGPSVTPVYANDRLLVVQGATGTFSGKTWTAPTGTTEEAQSNATANASTGLADQILGAAAATGTRVSTYGASANLTSVVIALAQPPSTLYLHHDQLGSTRMLTDSTGVVRATFTYNPYGTVTASTGYSTAAFLFAGQYRDAATGFYYLRARYYDPSTAQFLTVDPDVATTLSPYGYVAGDPLNAGDPSGLCGWAPWDLLSCVDSNSIQSQRELAHPTGGQELQNLLNFAAILNMEDGGGEAIEGCELATEGATADAGSISIDENAAGHIFNDAPGHLPDDTTANRALLTDTANNPANLLGTDQYGSDWYAQTQNDGSQIWARVQSTGIRSGGVNPSPGTWDPVTGLYWP